MTAPAALRPAPVLCAACQAGEDCGACTAQPGQPCVTAEPGIHLSRLARGRKDGLISDAEMASLIPDIFTAATVVLAGDGTQSWGKAAP